jgi:hypothetical protein
VLDSLSTYVLRPDIVEGAIADAVAALRPSADASEAQRLERQLTSAKEEAANLAAALARGGEMKALDAMKARESLQARLQRELDGLLGLPQLTDFDVRTVERELRNSVARAAAAPHVGLAPDRREARARAAGVHAEAGPLVRAHRPGPVWQIPSGNRVTAGVGSVYRLNTHGNHPWAREGGVRTLIDRRLQARGARDAVWASLIALTTKAADSVQASAATIAAAGMPPEPHERDVGCCNATAPARSPRRSDGAIQSDPATRDRTHAARGRE